MHDMQYEVTRMTRLAASTARADFGDLLSRVAYTKERIVLHRHGKDVAAVIPIEDFHLLERLIEELEDRLDIEDAQEALKEPGRIPWEKVKAGLGL
jgi:prevent-host-death family protein